MRRLMWFAVGFAAACAFTAYILTSFWLLAVAAGILCLCIPARLLLPAGNARGIALCIAIGAAIGLLWCQLYDYNNLEDARKLDGQEMRMRLTAVDYCVTTETSNVATCHWQERGMDCRVLVYLPKDLQVAPGDELKARFLLRFTGLNGDRAANYHRGEGIVLLAYPQEDIRVSEDKQMDLRYFPQWLRHGILQTIESIFPEDTVAFAKALLLGHTEELSYKTDTELKISGIRHVVAVSGLHVSFILALVFLLIGRRSVLVFCINLPLLLLFGAVIGFTPSVVRACIMQLILLLAACVKREYDPLTALSTAVLILLCSNPQTVASVGFQLSVGCVAGIVLFSGKILQRLQKLSWVGTVKGTEFRYRCKRYILSSIAVSLSATVVTMPLSILYFGMVSLVAPLTNIVCLWLISYLFVGGILCCALGAVFPVAGAAMAWVLAWGIRGVLWVAGVIAKIPFGAVYTQDGNILAWIILTYLLLFAYFCIPRLRKKALLWLIPILLTVAITASVISVRLDDYRLTVLDVGQGQCVLLQADGRTYMVDCGGSSDEQAADVAAAQLLSQGISRLDGLILTHYDEDHVGGVTYLLDRIAVDKLYLQKMQDDRYLPQILEKYGKRPVYINKDKALRWEGNQITMYGADSEESSNENSMCILFQTEECAILITGDRDQAGEEALLEQYSLPRVDILIVGHHGSKTSTSGTLLQDLRIETAVISVGENNQHGHPDASVLRLLEQYECEIYRTDLDGTVVIRG